MILWFPNRRMVTKKGWGPGHEYDPFWSNVLVLWQHCLLLSLGRSVPNNRDPEVGVTSYGPKVGTVDEVQTLLSLLTLSMKKQAPIMEEDSEREEDISGEAKRSRNIVGSNVLLLTIGLLVGGDEASNMLETSIRPPKLPLVCSLIQWHTIGVVSDHFKIGFQHNQAQDCI